MRDRDHHAHWFHLVIGDDVVVVEWPWDVLTMDDALEFRRGLTGCMCNDTRRAYLRLQAYVGGWEARLGVRSNERRVRSDEFFKKSA